MGGRRGERRDQAEGPETKEKASEIGRDYQDPNSRKANKGLKFWVENGRKAPRNMKPVAKGMRRGASECSPRGDATPSMQGGVS